MEAELQYTEKWFLIQNNIMDAYYAFINHDNYEYYADGMEIAEGSMMEISGVHTTKQHQIAMKNVLFQMLRKGMLK